MPISACKTRHRMVPAGGLNLFVREAGERTQPAVLLIHGQPTSSHTFRNLMPLLADTAYLVAPDMPGFGFSDAPPLDRYEYSFENIAHDPYYQLDEIVAYARELDRLEMHVFDGAHLLLETHYRECADAIQRFIENNPREVASIG